MKLIKISTGLELTVHEFPSGSRPEQNEALRKLIGDGCSMYECVRPNKLYTVCHMEREVTDVPGECVSMLVDEEGLLKEKPVLNIVGSYLHEADRHNIPITGNILFVGEKWCGDGIDFCGIEESVFNRLKLQLGIIIHTTQKALMPALYKKL